MQLRMSLHGACQMTSLYAGGHRLPPGVWQFPRELVTSAGTPSNSPMLDSRSNAGWCDSRHSSLHVSRLVCKPSKTTNPRVADFIILCNSRESHGNGSCSSSLTKLIILAATVGAAHTMASPNSLTSCRTFVPFDNRSDFHGSHETRSTDEAAAFCRFC